MPVVRSRRFTYVSTIGATALTPIIRLSVTHLNLEASALLVRHITLLKALEISHGVLDLACGSGRNGRYLLSRGLPVVFADIDGEKLASLSAVEFSDPAMVTLWEVDFESKADDPLTGKTFDAIMVFNYLHRALIDRIKQAVRPEVLCFMRHLPSSSADSGAPAIRTSCSNPMNLELGSRLGRLFIMKNWSELIPKPCCESGCPKTLGLQSSEIMSFCNASTSRQFAPALGRDVRAFQL